MPTPQPPGHGDPTSRRRVFLLAILPECLVDGAGLIRWHVHSSKPPTTEEVATLTDILHTRSWESESSDQTVGDGAAAAATKIAQRNIDAGASRDGPRAARLGIDSKVGF